MPEHPDEEKELRDEIVAAIMSLLRPQRRETPTIEELERILNSETTDEISVLPDGSVTVITAMTTTVGAVADQVIGIVRRLSPAPQAGQVTEALPAVFGDRIVICKAWDGWPAHPECAAKEWMSEDYQQWPDPELVRPSRYATSNCFLCRKPLIRAGIGSKGETDG